MTKKPKKIFLFIRKIFQKSWLIYVLISITFIISYEFLMKHQNSNSQNEEILKKDDAQANINTARKKNSCYYYAYSPIYFFNAHSYIATTPNYMGKYVIYPARFKRVNKGESFKDGSKSKVVKVRDAYTKYHAVDGEYNKVSESVEIKSSFLWLKDNCLTAENSHDIAQCIERSHANYKNVNKINIINPSTVNYRKVPPEYKIIYPEKEKYVEYVYEKLEEDSYYIWESVKQKEELINKVNTLGGSVKLIESLCGYDNNILNILKEKFPVSISGQASKKNEWGIYMKEIHAFQKKNGISIGPLSYETLMRLGIDINSIETNKK